MDDEYVEAVLAVVEAVPPGRAMSYGAVAEAVAHRLRRGGPRQVARVLALHGGAVPWWRVVNAVGRLPPGHEVAARRALVAEGCPMTADGRRVDLARAGWWPAPGDPNPVDGGWWPGAR
ncbi:MAG TPA: MGMT family protein [Jiangellales bacterium]|nr:MGMT family protein [Jiangellales bacterium]